MQIKQYLSLDTCINKTINVKKIIQKNFMNLYKKLKEL